MIILFLSAVQIPYVISCIDIYRFNRLSLLLLQLLSYDCSKSLACVAGGIVSAREIKFWTSERRSREENGERDSEISEIMKSVLSLFQRNNCWFAVFRHKASL